MDYKIKLDKGDYITQTHRKLFPYALKWCLEHGETSCRVNKTYFYFYFDKLLVTIIMENKKRRDFIQEGCVVEVEYTDAEKLLGDYENLICELISLYMGIYGCDIEEVIECINDSSDYFMYNIRARKEVEDNGVCD